jgi:hypothetical protein
MEEGTWFGGFEVWWDGGALMKIYGGVEFEK